MSQQVSPRKPCLPAAAQKELEELRRALDLALRYWAGYERHYVGDGTPPLRNQDGPEGEDYRRCRVLLDPPKAE